eukprot:361630-Chlamydomonas_euryale.AAC.5
MAPFMAPRSSNSARGPRRTFASEYCVFCSTASIDSLMMLLTSSATNAACGPWSAAQRIAGVLANVPAISMKLRSGRGRLLATRPAKR